MPPARSPSSVNVNRLSVIAEDAPSDAQGARQPEGVRRSHRPFDQRWPDNPPRPSYEASPPTYELGDISRSKAEALRRLRDNRQIARRGGCGRLVLILLAVIVVAVALGVGLGVGLTRNRGSSSANASPSSSPDIVQPFPAGAYAISTYLTTTTTDCTAQASTWRCFPYSTYSPSTASAALIPFNWLINSSATTTASASVTAPSSSASYMISSSDNPFAITFSNVSLTLVDAGKSSERYTFALPLDKYVVPSAPITSDNTAAACWYNATRFEASLYTKMPAGVNDTASTTGSAPPTPSPTNGWQAWPFAVSVTQRIAGGDNVPNCYQTVNGTLGTPVTQGLGPKPPSDVCACGWQNFGLK